MKTVLFICTGNYYRSRFAEILFNALAQEASIEWSAESRGLHHDIPGNVGPISPYTLAGLAERNIVLPGSLRFPLPLLLADLEAASHIIALDEVEHRPPMEQRFPDWNDKVVYWTIADTDRATVADALAALELQVRALLAHLVAEK